MPIAPDDPLGRLAARRITPPAPAEVCPDAAVWAAYVDGGLTREEIEPLERHLVRCERCRALVAALTPVDVAAEPEEATRATGGLLSRVDWRWMSVAATILAGLSLWWVVRPDRSTGLPARAPVAMVAESQPQPTPAGPIAQVSVGGPPPAHPAQPASKAEQRVRTALGRADTPASGTEPPARTGPAELAANLSAELAERTMRQGKTAGADGRAASAESAPVTVVDSAASAPARVPAPIPSARPEPDVVTGAIQVTSAADQTRGGRASSGEVTAVFAEPGGRLQWRIVAFHRIESSSDGGKTWTPRFSDVSVRLLDGTAPEIESAWVVGSPGVVLRLTVPGGWTRVTRPADEAIVSVSATDGTNARVTTASGRRFETSDGGATWQPGEP